MSESGKPPKCSCSDVFTSSVKRDKPFLLHLSTSWRTADNAFEETDVLNRVSDTEAENMSKDIFTLSFKAEHKAN